MPTLLRRGPFRYFFVSLDRGEPPHVHVERDDYIAKIWLDPVRVERNGGFRHVDLKTIVDTVEEYREQFLDNWYEFFED